MGKKPIIRNDNTFRGRFKGNTETRISNPKIRENWDKMKWGSEDYFWCDECKKFVDGRKEDGCNVCKGRIKNERIEYENY